MPDFLKALTLPRITQARATNDYDGETGSKHGVNGYHNFAAPDQAWPFWGTRMGVSKDNFWTEYNDLSQTMYPNSQTSHNAELHAFVALMTGVVGIGDWQNMTNGTLVRRLARHDGILLKPDRPLGPMDLMLGGCVDRVVYGL